MASRKPASPRRRKSETAKANQKAAASPTAKKTGRVGDISPYPDLKIAIKMLEQRATHVGEDRKRLIDKWLVQLQKVQAEMVRLRKLEKLAGTLAQPQQESLPL
ncbi:MAG: hypothetical protein H6922_00430 [Pseudomonadaceae bacterium]|nr:hypothetical protein [Pseudomonadaceae bacterium]